MTDLCHALPIPSVEHRAVPAMLQPTVTVTSIRTRPRSTAGRTTAGLSRQTEPSARCVQHTSCGILSALCVRRKPPVSSTTSHRIVAMTDCSGIRATGKAYVSGVTDKRLQGKCGIPEAGPEYLCGGGIPAISKGGRAGGGRVTVSRSTVPCVARSRHRRAAAVQETGHLNSVSCASHDSDSGTASTRGGRKILRLSPVMRPRPFFLGRRFGTGGSAGRV